MSSLNISIQKVRLWTDSTIVLSWIKSPSRTWKTFVSNRVSEIQTLTKDENWHHVRTNENPADIISRGTTLDELSRSTLWWQGPDWLSMSAENFPTLNSADSQQINQNQLFESIH
ncbi:hypothetical protein QE152_g28489 [Popillia japonica]|uniref:RNase H type-1 domain-containing protein n=1 Tax=Popillia japonica TaxID=7064 RepID=A0AAW1JK10_POPJA